MESGCTPFCTHSACVVMPEFFSSPFFSLGVGGVIGFAANWFFYRRSRAAAELANQLQRQTAERQIELLETQLRHLRTLAKASERAGFVKLVRDASGEVTGGAAI
jgi:hypothetical protein